MKKTFYLMLVVLFIGLALYAAMPGQTKAMTIQDRFNGNAYNGTWELTSDPCEPENVGNTGYISFQTLSLKRKGGLKVNNAVWFDETSVTMTGRVYKKNDKFRVRFTYPVDDTSWDGLIKGRITQKRIRGTYTHSSDGCTWGGSFNAPRQYN
ncbi:MAG: hypothetical protein WC752_01945 [Patescibacteria group bacterium]|jgi:hypothetical protein